MFHSYLLYSQFIQLPRLWSFFLLFLFAVATQEFLDALSQQPVVDDGMFADAVVFYEFIIHQRKQNWRV